MSGVVLVRPGSYAVLVAPDPLSLHPSPIFDGDFLPGGRLQLLSDMLAWQLTGMPPRGVAIGMPCDE